MSLLYGTYVIWYREMLRYIRNYRYLLAQLLFPLIIIVALGFGFGGIVTMPMQGISYIQFLSSGILVFFVAGGAMGGGFNLIEERKEGFLKVVIIAPISRFAIILGKIAARCSFSTLQVLVFAGIIATFAPVRFELLWLTVLSLILMSAIFVCLGIIMACFLGDAEGYRMISGFFMFPIYFLSGIFFPVTSLPGWLEAIALVNPLTYAVDLFRYSLLGVHEFPLVWDAILLAVLSVILFVIATVLFDRKFRG